MCTHKSKCCIVPKDNKHSIMISALKSWGFRFGYPLTVTYIQNVNEYHALHPKYVDTVTAIYILGHTHKEHITMERNPLWKDF